jgi:hypothetical protein
MAGAVVTGELAAPPQVASSGIEFSVATEDDDAELRRLLRENPMAGGIRLSMEREPSYFAAARIEGDEHRTIVARERGRIVCAGGVSVRERFVNGLRTRVGYLGSLRLDRAYRGHLSILRRGYDLFRQLKHELNVPLCFTSIVSDNTPARRLFERGLPGLPTYTRVGELVTLVIRRRRNGEFWKPTKGVRGALKKRGLELAYGDDDQIAGVASLLSREYPAYQLSPTWSADDLRQAPGSDSFRVGVSPMGKTEACAALWDQRTWKQTVVRGYSRRLRWLRPILNAGAWVAGRPRLPAVGQPLSMGFVSHLVASDEHTVEQLIWLLHSAATARGIDYLVLGFDARDARLPHLRKVFRPREYRSRLHCVHWPDEGPPLGFDGRLLYPEVALL